jgi:hypothetical protein
MHGIIHIHLSSVIVIVIYFSSSAIVSFGVSAELPVRLFVLSDPAIAINKMCFLWI